MNDVTLWLIVNLALFLYVGCFQLYYGYGPGGFLSAGAAVLAVVYLLLWMMSRGSKELAYRWIMVVSGLAVLGDLLVVGWLNAGSLSSDSALLDAAGLLLFHSAYGEYRGAVRLSPRPG